MGVNSIVLTEKEQKEIIKERTKRAEKMIEAIKKELDEANLKLNMVASDDPDKTNKILEAAKITKSCQDNFEMWSKYLQDIPNIIMNRSKKNSKRSLKSFMLE